MKTATTYSAPSKLLDGFRRALDVLIATAPGTPAEIQHELQDALRAFSQQGAIQAINKQESRLAGHLMILGFGQVSRWPARLAKPDCDHLGFNPATQALGDVERLIDALVLEATRSNGKKLLSPGEAINRLQLARPDCDHLGFEIRAKLMADHALNETHQHQARLNAKRAPLATTPAAPQCPACNYSPALLRLAGGVVPHAPGCQRNKEAQP